MLKHSFASVIVAVVSLPVLFFSCKQDVGKKLIGKWRSVRIENKDKDNFFASSKLFIDTMGKGNNDSTNFEIYGVTNMDSLRRELRNQFDSAYAAQRTIDTQSTITFNTDSTAVFGFPGKSEKGRWFIDRKGRLILDETNELGQTKQLKVLISQAAPDSLQLTFMLEIEEGLADTSVVTFKREK